MYVIYVMCLCTCRGVPCPERSQGLFTHAVHMTLYIFSVMVVGYIKYIYYVLITRRTLDYQDVLGALNKKGIAIRVASPKLVMEEVSKPFDYSI